MKRSLMIVLCILLLVSSVNALPFFEGSVWDRWFSGAVVHESSTTGFDDTTGYVVRFLNFFIVKKTTSDCPSNDEVKEYTIGRFSKKICDFPVSVSLVGGKVGEATMNVGSEHILMQVNSATGTPVQGMYFFLVSIDTQKNEVKVKVAKNPFQCRETFELGLAKYNDNIRKWECTTPKQCTVMKCGKEVQLTGVSAPGIEPKAQFNIDHLSTSLELGKQRQVDEIYAYLFDLDQDKKTAKVIVATQRVELPKCKTDADCPGIWMCEHSSGECISRPSSSKTATTSNQQGQQQAISSSSPTAGTGKKIGEKCNTNEKCMSGLTCANGVDCRCSLAPGFNTPGTVWNCKDANTLSLVDVASCKYNDDIIFSCPGGCQRVGTVCNGVLSGYPAEKQRARSAYTSVCNAAGTTEVHFTHENVPNSHVKCSYGCSKGECNPSQPSSSPTAGTGKKIGEKCNTNEKCMSGLTCANGVDCRCSLAPGFNTPGTVWNCKDANTLSLVDVASCKYNDDIIFSCPGGCQQVGSVCNGVLSGYSAEKQRARPAYTSVCNAAGTTEVHFTHENVPNSHVKCSYGCSKGECNPSQPSSSPAPSSQ